MEFFRSGSGKRIPKRQILNKAVSVSILFTLVLAAAASGGCGLTVSKETPDENERFGAYTDELFRNEISSDTVSLHYTLKDPEAYGVVESEPTFGSIVTDAGTVKASAENMQQALLEYDYASLDIENRLIYDILNYRMKMIKKQADYILYEEPLGRVSGV